MRDRERLEDNGGHLAGIAIGVIVAVAAVLRFWGLSGGIPVALGVDEPQVMVRSLTMVKTGDFHPHFFDYPGLYLYLQAGVIVVRFLAGASSGLWSSLAQVSDYDFYLWGRAVTATFGTATVYLLYLAGRRWSPPHALLAAALLAVIPIHVRESHFVLTDVPATFFVVLAFLLSFRAHERGTGIAFALAGAAAGLAAGTKYTAWLAILFPLAAAAAAGGSVELRVRRAAAAVAAFGGAFLVVAPYTILDLPAFLNGFGALSAAVPKRAAAADPGWQLYLKHLRGALGWPGAVLTGVGLASVVVGVVRGPVRLGCSMLLLFVSVFWLMVVDRTLIFARYLMPIVPFVCLMAAMAVVACAAGLRRFAPPRAAVRAVAAALTVAMLAQPAATSISFNRMMSRPTTLGVAADWIGQNVSPGAFIVHELASLHFPPERYTVVYLTYLTDKTLDFYLDGRVDYVVATSAVYQRFFDAPDQFSERHQAYQKLFGSLAPVHVVRPSGEHPGPEVRIFRVPK